MSEKWSKNRAKIKPARFLLDFRLTNRPQQPVSVVDWFQMSTGEQNMNDQFITKSELAALLHVCEKTIERYSYTNESEKKQLEKQGRQGVRKYRVGRRVLYRMIDIDEFLKDHPSYETRASGRLISECDPLHIRTGRTAFPSHNVPPEQMTFWKVSDGE
jgi:hypothetical protein